MPQYMHPIMMPVQAAVAACVAELDRALIVNTWKIAHNARDWAQLWHTTCDEDTCAKHMLTRFLRRAGLPRADADDWGACTQTISCKCSAVAAFAHCAEASTQATL